MTVQPVVCPSCDSSTNYQQIKYVGEIVDCEACAQELEVVSLEPISLAIAPEPDEDWGE